MVLFDLISDLFSHLFDLKNDHCSTENRLSKCKDASVSQITLQATDSKCHRCQQKATLMHILCGCPKQLSMYTYRHNQVLEVVGKALESLVARFNSQTPSTKVTTIPFVSAGAPTKCSTKSPLGILSAACDWELRLDLEKRLYFPPDIVVTDLRPDIVIWSKNAKTVVIGELTVPWETNVDERHEFKKAKYTDLVAECTSNGWKVHCMPFEVGARGFICNSFSIFFSRLGAGCRSRKRTASDAAVAASRSSAWIWNKFHSSSKSTHPTAP